MCDVQTDFLFVVFMTAGKVAHIYILVFITVINWYYIHNFY